MSGLSSSRSNLPPKQPSSLSRRDLFKLGGAGLAGLLLNGEGIFNPRKALGAGLKYSYHGDFRDLAPDQQGRVVEGSIKVYDIPSFNGNEVKVYWRDTVLPITDVTIGDDEPKYNRVWYRIGEEGYVHSGSLQPVRTIPQEASVDIPEGGRLAEVTVPFTDAYWGPGKENRYAYRYYYDTTYWVDGLVEDSAGEPWYRMEEDKFKFIFYAPAKHIRLIPYGELAVLSPEVPAFEKRIEVYTEEQLIIAYEFDTPVFVTRVATGASFADGDYSTPTGHFVIYSKRPSRHMASTNRAANGYDLPGVPWVCYFTEDGIAFHGTFWHNDYGKKRSHGCINLSPQAAKWIFRWTLPSVDPAEESHYDPEGTPIDIF